MILAVSQSHSGGIVAYSEVILGRDFPFSELEIGWEIPASPAKHGIACRIAPDRFASWNVVTARLRVFDNPISLA